MFRIVISTAAFVFLFSHHCSASHISETNSHSINRCKTVSGKPPQNEYLGETFLFHFSTFTFVETFLLTTLYWNSLSFVAMTDLKGYTTILCHSFSEISVFNSVSDLSLELSGRKDHLLLY